MNYLTINKKSWDSRTQTHIASKFYDVDGFIKGSSSLKEIELSELKGVKDKTMLHLQCHFGQDTLSWARKGAIVTGVDLSSEAIKQANKIKQTTQLEADFICSDIYELGVVNNKLYDIVFTSYGAIVWLPCLNKWADTIAKNLKSGGMFYMVEFHPAYDLFSGYPYFHLEQPDIEEEGTYTENCDGTKTTSVTWAHPLSDVINALIQAGIQIDRVNEFPFSPYNCFEGLEERAPGRFYLADSKHDIPLCYSIRGTKNISK